MGLPVGSSEPSPRAGGVAGCGRAERRWPAARLGDSRASHGRPGRPGVSGGWHAVSGVVMDVCVVRRGRGEGGCIRRRCRAVSPLRSWVRTRPFPRRGLHAVFTLSNEGKRFALAEQSPAEPGRPPPGAQRRRQPEYADESEAMVVGAGERVCTRADAGARARAHMSTCARGRKRALRVWLRAEGLRCGC